MLGVVSGKLDIGVAQSEVLYQASQGLGRWAPYGRLRNLRSICTLFTKSLTIVARDDSGLVNLTDLAGKSINIGERGTGTYSNSLQLLAWLKSKTGVEPGKTLELSFEDALVAYRENRLDSILTNLSHPAPYLDKIFKTGVPTHFVKIANIREFVKDYPSYSEEVLSAKLYPEATDLQDLDVIATPTILFTQEGFSTPMVQHLTYQFIMNLTYLRREIPELETTREENLFADSILPAHVGAINAFYDAGLIRMKAPSARNPLMAISFESANPVASQLSAQLCKRVNEKQLRDTRLVMLTCEDENESICRTVANNAHLGFASASELYYAWNGQENWRSTGAMQNLTSIGKAYNIALLLLTPSEKPAENLPLLLPQATASSRNKALLDYVQAWRGENGIVKALPIAEAYHEFNQGAAVLLLPVEVSPQDTGNNEHAYLTRLLAHLSETGLKGRLEAVPPEPAALKACPWFDQVMVELDGKKVAAACMPVMLYASLNAPSERLLPILESLVGKLNVSDTPRLSERLRYLAQKPPIPFHPVVETLMEKLVSQNEALSQVITDPLPARKVYPLTIAADKSSSGGLYCAGILSYVLSQADETMRLLAYCAPAESEEMAINQVVSGKVEMGIVPATLLYEAVNGLGAWEGRPQQRIKVVGSMFTVPLALYAASPDLLEKNDPFAKKANKKTPPPTLRSYIGKRVSAPDVTQRLNHRGKSITIFNPSRFRDALSNRTMINTAEGGMNEAFDMYNKGTIEGFFVTAMHPFDQMNRSILPRRAGYFIPINEGYDFVISMPYYINTVLQPGLLSYYKLAAPQQSAIPTLGVPMMLITSDRVQADLVQGVLEIIGKSSSDIGETHPFFEGFNVFSLLNGISIARIHEGASKFYQDEGLIASPGKSKEYIFQSLGTGTPDGSFFGLGSYLERVINARMISIESDYRITLETTDGSQENCIAVNSFALQLGISQADLLAQAYYHQGGIFEQPLPSLRSVCNLSDIPLLLVVREDLPAQSIRDLKGTKLNIGALGSGTRATVDPILDLPGINLRGQAELREDPDTVALDRLYSGGLDGIFIAIGHSSVSIKLMAVRSGFRVLPLNTPEILKASLAKPYLLSKRLYPGLPQDTPTIATRATLIANKDVSQQVIEDFLTAIIKFRQLVTPTPINLQNLTDAGLAADLTIPLHPGAKAAYEKAGISVPAIPE